MGKHYVRLSVLTEAVCVRSEGDGVQRPGLREAASGLQNRRGVRGHLPRSHRQHVHPHAPGQPAAHDTSDAPRQ